MRTFWSAIVTVKAVLTQSPPIGMCLRPTNFNIGNTFDWTYVTNIKCKSLPFADLGSITLKSDLLFTITLEFVEYNYNYTAFEKSILITFYYFNLFN